MTETEKWKSVETFFQQNFTDGEIPTLETMLFLIGVQELGKGKATYKKDDKLNLIHIAVCKLLEPFGYYTFSGFDEDNWPTYTSTETLPNLQSNEQTLLMKKAIIHYFESEELF